ncbi:MAG: hypothetical protein IT445_09670 [Phycisphaeraceae bacterium]|nr:hypothetical protein [Phycisphaeraceae bacterium]
MPLNFNWQGNPVYNRWQRGIGGRPAWVTRAALTAGVLVIVVPLVLLTLAAVLVGALVFATLSAVAWLLGQFSGVGPRADDGRRNVRIIERP